jgi:hypothetical protein
LFTKIISLLLAIPKIIEAIRALFAMWRTSQKESEEKENAEIRKEIENAKTPEEKQNALNRFAKRFGRK